MNDYKIQVTGLASGKYRVRIDSVDVAELTSEQRATGMDISAEVLKPGPLADQAKKVKEAVENKKPVPPRPDFPWNGFDGSSVVDLFGRVVLRSIAVHGVADEEKIKALLRPLFDTHRRDRLYMPVEVEVVG